MNANTYPWREWGCTKEPSLCWLPTSLLDNLGPNWDADWSAGFPNKEKGRECCCCQLWFCGSLLVKLWEFSISADGCPPPKLVWWWGNVLFSGTESAELGGGVACIAWGYPCSARYGHICVLLEVLEWSPYVALPNDSWSFGYEDWKGPTSNRN